jgi:hypothetical protein
MIKSFTNTFVMRLATIAGSGSTAQRRFLAALITTTTLLLAIAGAASAATFVPITVNSANWMAAGSVVPGTVAPAAYLDGQDLVHLQGAVTQTSQSGNLDFIGIVPAGDRPNRAVYTIVHTFNGTFADLAINAQGQIFLIPSSATGTHFVSLEGITYQPGNANPPSPINLNTANWLGSVCCGATGPGAYATTTLGAGPPGGGDEIVHLQGAVKQKSSSGSDPNLIGTLPSDVEPPNRSVYTIVHTGSGTFADLAINPQGQIFLIPTPTLTGSNTQFVSLEGISYNQGELINGGVESDPGWGLGGFGAGGGFPSNDAIFWIEDGQGFIHLEGGVNLQTSCNPTCPEIALLPPQIRPSRNLYFVVHTFAGTFADLSIGTNGAINVIPDTLYGKPSDLSFLSLEGLTWDAPSPKFFGLRANGTESNGATVTVDLRKPRVLALLVQVKRRHRPVTMGLVHLGTRTAGRSRIHWNLRVKGRLLPAGSYEVSLHALTGKLLSVPADPGVRTLVVSPDGHVRVQ